MEHRQKNSIDWLLFGSMLPIIGAGLITMSGLGSDAKSFFLKQSIFAIISIILFFLSSRFDVRIFKESRLLMRLFVAFLSILLVLFIVGHTAKGAKSWFSFGGFSFQPVDAMKLVVILLLAKYFSRRHVAIGDWKHVIVSSVYAFVPFVLVFLQPDFGSAMVIFFVWFGMLLASGLRRKQLLILVSVGIVAFACLWVGVFKPYQKARIENFLNPMSDIRGSGYNVYQSTIAVGSGQFLGKGVGFGTQSRLQYLPEYQTDFIFSAFAEEWGFLGSVLLLLFYLVLIWRIIYIAQIGATNFEILFGTGIAILFISHIVINVGMNIGLMPVTGIPLPLMSYGGSHLLMECVALGLLSSTLRYSRATHPDRMKNEFLGSV